MLDIRSIRNNPELLSIALMRRGWENARELAQGCLIADAKLRDVIGSLEQARARRNELSAQIGAAKREATDSSKLEIEASKLKEDIEFFERAVTFCKQEFQRAMEGLPNIPADDVPDGKTPFEVSELRYLDSSRTIEREHDQIGVDLGMLDFETAAEVSGARYVYLLGPLARMERALANFMLDVHGVNGYTEIVPPVIVKSAAMFGTGQLPKFAGDLFGVGDDWLIPTAEVSLTNMIRRKGILNTGQPLRLTAWTPCFRSEAGAAGRDTRGLTRLHQFSKVELVSIVKPDESESEHERMLSDALTILKRLELPHRVMMLAAEDLGFSAAKTYDIEVWMPGAKCWREISSVSNCGDFQSRRMGVRYTGGDRDQRHPHTLNGSALAVGRTMAAIIETYVQENGSITVPRALRRYMDDDMRIEAQG